jgi:photosystem II stability/assembly factor-like uncharacterized protein
MTRSLSLVVALSLSAISISAANWTSGGPRGGVMLTLSATASNPRVVYAGGYDGVFRSDDNGETWRKVSGVFSGATSIAADPADPNIAYVIASTVYRTTDGGVTWVRMNTGLARPNKILIDPSAPKTVYVSGDCGQVFKTVSATNSAGISKSTDGGESWNGMTKGFPDFGIGPCVVNLALDPANPQHLYANAEFAAGGFESLDGAATWTSTKVIVPVASIVGDPKSLRRFGTDTHNVLASTDGGQTWSVQLGEGLPDSGSGPHVIAMTLDPSVPRIFSATSHGLYRSGDSGRSWLPAGDVPSVVVHSSLFNAADSTVMIATSEGLFRAPSPAFTPWKHLDVPEQGIDLITSIAVDPQRPSVIFAASRDELQGRIFRSIDTGATWQQMTGPLDLGSNVGVDGSGDAWFGGYAGTLYRIPSGTNDVIATKQFSRIYAVAGSPTVPGRVYLSNGSVWRTDDSGANWRMCGNAGPLVQELALNPADPELVYAASLDGAYGSTDGCATFHPLNHHPDQTGVQRIASAPSNPSVLYRFNTNRSASRSDDGGASWTLLPIPEWFVTKVIVDPHDAFGVWIVGSGVVRHSSDGGLTWTDVSGGLPLTGSGIAYSLAIDAAGTTIHAGLFFKSVWELKIPPARRRSAATP